MSNTLTSEVDLILEDAMRAVVFEPADATTLLNLRVFISQGMDKLKHRGRITGYSINMSVNNSGTGIVGNVLFSPIPLVQEINIDFMVGNVGASKSDKFARAMKGV